jgi:hypothetical protein
MKYIKTNDEYHLNEELSLKITWKQIVIGLCLFVAYKHYFPNKKKKDITIGEMNKIVSDIDSKPNIKEKYTIDSIKNSLILDIKQDNKISEDKKKKLITGIYNIPFVMVDTETINLIIGSEKIIGCYFGYMDRDKMVTMILINRERVKLDDVDFSETTLHELSHLVDDLLVDGRKEYSELSNIIDILDKDIVLRNEEGEKKLRNKVNNFVDIMIKKQVDPKKINLPEVKKLTQEIKEDYFRVIFLDKKKMDYLTSSSEIYVRFHGLKRWMIKNGYLKDMNSEITQDIIVEIMQSEYFHDKNIVEKEFFQLLFYMDVDFTGKNKSDVSKLNSIVTNYKDYISNEKPV